MKIEIERLGKRFGWVDALREVSMAIESGEIIAVVGTNGAGKTTLLRALAGVVAPTRGSLRFDGEAFNRKRLDLRKQLFFLPDFPFLFEHWDLVRTIGMTLKLYGVDSDAVTDRVMELLDGFDLVPFSRIPVQKLSRGQRYKVALTAFLAANPRLWLLDEPFASGMDPDGLKFFRRQATEASKQGRTIVYTTQIIELAERFCSRAAVLHEGRLRWFDDPVTLEKNEGDGGLESVFKRLREKWD